MPTLLASKILKNLYLPIKKRNFDDHGGILHRLAEAKYFDCDDIFDLALNFAEKIDTKTDFQMPSYVVLPAEKTWLEWCNKDGSRQGVFFETDKNVKKGRLSPADRCRSGRHVEFNYEDPKKPVCIINWKGETNADEIRFQYQMFIYYIIPCLLSIINTPKICKHIIRSKRYGLPARSISGKWPSDDTWTEVKIYVDEAVHRDPTIIGPLTGRKALHFVRTHYRYRLGRLEMVRPHWRGDASLGIVRSRYTATFRGVEARHRHNRLNHI